MDTHAVLAFIVLAAWIAIIAVVGMRFARERARRLERSGKDASST
jgi:hypothetical protein